MTYDDEITLIETVTETVPPGVEVVTEKANIILCAVRMLYRSDFNAARMAGLNPEMEVIVHTFEYHGERLAVFHGCRYRITGARLYGFQEMALECSRVLGV